MSFESNDLHLWQSLLNKRDEKSEYQHYLVANSKFSDLTWPIRMVRQRRLIRKSTYSTRSHSADLLLDMPNLSKDWSEFEMLNILKN